MTWFKRLLAYFHIAYVCEMSKGDVDYHDYMDSYEDTYPWHMMEMTCKHCGKKYHI